MLPSRRRRWSSTLRRSRVAAGKHDRAAARTRAGRGRGLAADAGRGGQGAGRGEGRDRAIPARSRPELAPGDQSRGRAGGRAAEARAAGRRRRRRTSCRRRRRRRRRRCRSSRWPTVAAAPVQGAPTVDDSNAIPTWRNAVVALLERNKRYPAERADARGTAQVAFSLDRRGRVIVEPHRDELRLRRARSRGARHGRARSRFRRRPRRFRAPKSRSRCRSASICADLSANCRTHAFQPAVHSPGSRQSKRRGAGEDLAWEAVGRFLQALLPLRWP